MGVSAKILIHVPKQRKHITGEPITGILKFHLDKDTVYKSITLSLIGRGICFLDQQLTSVENIKACTILLNDDTSDVTLSAGHHEYPFELVVPENIPPSVNIKNGSIKYKLVLKLKRPELLSWNKVYKSKIEIHPRVDSTLSDQPVIAALNKTLNKCFSSKNREIGLETLLDKEYLTPGGQRNICFVVTNNSDISFKVRTELISKTNYLIPKRKNKLYSKQHVVRSSTVETPKVPENCVSNMSNIIPVKPDLCTVRHSQIFNREYKIRVTVKLPMPHANASVEIPVFVGEKVEESREEAGEAIEAPPSYWETMLEDKEKDD